ncbi:translational activator of cytochrome c oxidase 1 [Haemorhous mexicanus]|uniref:translational activator of cytochrome c oxidase 1 n=1 Tax=Haemorhous mexicanus TaxID=30427 RepID=UPI0028BE081E|nr:translational activator of cytochrome c oxidase 1 [Haemorhous mexicanus]
MAAPMLRAPGLLQPLRAPLRGSLGAARCPPSPAALPGPLPVLLAVAPGPVPVRAMAGHNRWSKVRNVKGPRDAERSRLCEKMARMLRAAAREGGPEPSLNPGLAAVVAQCRALNVPKATIEGALRSARERPAGGSRVLLSARGPAGALVLLDVRTDNVRRSQAELRTLLGRHGASLTDDVRHAFEAVGVVRVSGRTLAMEAALEVAALAGAQDVVAEEEEEEEEAELKFLCDPSALGGVHQHLVAAGLRPMAAGVEFRPRSALALPDGARAAAERLLRALAECPGVVRLFHNIQDGPAGAPGARSAPAAPPERQ